MENIRKKELEIATKREHDFYMSLLKVNENLLFEVDVTKLRQLSNAYLIVQDSVKQAYEFWDKLAHEIGNENSIVIRKSDILRNLMILKYVLDDDIPGEKK